MRELAAWLIPTVLAAAALSYLGTRALIRTLPARLLDVPNERSSHREPVKRGGGLAIVAVVLGGALLHGASTGEPGPLLPFVAGGLLVAAVSLADDVRSLSSFARLPVHALAAALALWAYGGALSTPLLALALIWVVGLTNAYNFMDGIDGLAAAQAVIAALAWAVLGIAFGSTQVALVGTLTTGAAAGFYLHNRAPARIFMGDVGSAFLGYTFAVLPLLFGAHASTGAAAVSIVGAFVFDTTFTFLRRLLRREPVLRAHRSHLYQRLVIAGRSHAAVTRLYAGAGTLLALGGVAAMLGGRRWSLLALLLTAVTGTALWLHVRRAERRPARELTGV
jgi:UDP-N-acetylmuramyl pentapeptide phosphotransferase/UDP-N-acetylglucosamine-1-phosphate transferase